MEVFNVELPYTSKAKNKSQQTGCISVYPTHQTWPALAKRDTYSRYWVCYFIYTLSPYQENVRCWVSCFINKSCNDVWVYSV